MNRTTAEVFVYVYTLEFSPLSSPPRHCPSQGSQYRTHSTAIAALREAPRPMSDKLPPHEGHHCSNADTNSSCATSAWPLDQGLCLQSKSGKNAPVPPTATFICKKKDWRKEEGGGEEVNSTHLSTTAAHLPTPHRTIRVPHNAQHTAQRTLFSLSSPSFPPGRTARQPGRKH